MEVFHITLKVCPDIRLDRKGSLLLEVREPVAAVSSETVQQTTTNQSAAQVLVVFAKW